MFNFQFFTKSIDSRSELFAKFNAHRATPTRLNSTVESRRQCVLGLIKQFIVILIYRWPHIVAPSAANVRPAAAPGVWSLRTMLYVTGGHAGWYSGDHAWTLFWIQPSYHAVKRAELQTLLEIMKVSFYRAMHFSAYARSWDRMSSVCPSVRPSVCDVGDLWSHRLEILETNYTDN